MYRRIALLCVFVLIGGSLACVGSDEDDDFDQEDSPVIEGEESDAGDASDADDASLGDGDPDSGDRGEEVSEEVVVVEDREERNVAGVQVSFFDRDRQQVTLVFDRELNEGILSPPDFEESLLPGQFFRDLPLADGSQRNFVYYPTALLLAPYDVEARAIDEQGEVIDECSRPVTSVDAGLFDVVRVFFVIQCDHEVGMAQQVRDDGQGQVAIARVPDDDFIPDFGIELTITFNYAPIIETVEVEPSTTQKCPATTQICATVVEPDRDPVAFEWTQIEGPEPLAGPRETRFEEVEGVIEYCVEYDLADQDAHYRFALDVFDQFVENETPINIEAWYRQQDFGEIESRDSATVRFDVHCPKEKKYPEDPVNDTPDEDKPGDDPILDGISDKHFDDQKQKIKSWLWHIDDEEQRDELRSIIDGIDDPDQLQSVVNAITNGETVESVMDKIYSLK